MRFIPTDVDRKELTQEQLDVLKQQHESALSDYASKVEELTHEISVLQFKRSDLQKNLDLELAEKSKQIQKKESELNARILIVKEQEEKNYTIQSELKLREQRLKDIESNLIKKHNIHANYMAESLAINQKDKENIIARDRESSSMKNTAIAINSEASAKMADALKKEQEVEIKAQKLVHIEYNVNEDIQKQKDLKLSNENSLAVINKLKQELADEKLDFEKVKADNIRLRDDVDIATARLGKRKIDIDEREKSVKANEIRIEIRMNDLNLRGKEIENQQARLNQLKLDVETLLKLRDESLKQPQENKEA